MKINFQWVSACFECSYIPQGTGGTVTISCLFSCYWISCHQAGKKVSVLFKLKMTRFLKTSVMV